MAASRILPLSAAAQPLEPPLSAAGQPLESPASTAGGVTDPAHCATEQRCAAGGGLSPPAAAWEDSGQRRHYIRVVRPLLWAHKWQLRQLLASGGHRWVDDATNDDTSYARNFIRGLPGLAPCTAPVGFRASGYSSSVTEHCSSEPGQQAVGFRASEPHTFEALEAVSAPAGAPGPFREPAASGIVADLLALQRACAAAEHAAQREAGEVLAACVSLTRPEVSRGGAAPGCVVDLLALRAAQPPVRRRVLSAIMQVRKPYTMSYSTPSCSCTRSETCHLADDLTQNPRPSH